MSGIQRSEEGVKRKVSSQNGEMGTGKTKGSTFSTPHFLPDLDSFISPAHDLSSADVGDGRWQLAPLQDDILGDLAVRIDVNTLVVVTHQQLQPGCIGQDDDSVRLDGP